MSLTEMFSRKPEWESAIGRLMMASARLEMNVLMAIANYGGLDVARRASKAGHSVRLTMLQKLSLDRDENVRESAERIIDQLREFNQQRNHVAHNPLGYAFDDASSASHKYGAIIDFTDPGRRIGLDEIAALADKGENLSRGFTYTWMMVMGPPE